MEADTGTETGTPSWLWGAGKRPPLKQPNKKYFLPGHLAKCSWKRNNTHIERQTEAHTETHTSVFSYVHSEYPFKFGGQMAFTAHPLRKVVIPAMSVKGRVPTHTHWLRLRHRIHLTASVHKHTPFIWKPFFFFFKSTTHVAKTSQSITIFICVNQVPSHRRHDIQCNAF